MRQHLSLLSSSEAESLTLINTPREDHLSADWQEKGRRPETLNVSGLGTTFLNSICDKPSSESEQNAKDVV